MAETELDIRKWEWWSEITPNSVLSSHLESMDNGKNEKEHVVLQHIPGFCWNTALKTHKIKGNQRRSSEIYVYNIYALYFCLGHPSRHVPHPHRYDHRSVLRHRPSAQLHHPEDSQGSLDRQHPNMGR